MIIWYIFSVFGIMHQEKSGNPAGDRHACTYHDQEGTIEASILMVLCSNFPKDFDCLFKYTYKPFATQEPNANLGSIL
jgi:hypothetical protein